MVGKTWLRALLVIAGTTFLGLGVLGILVPLLPTTPFLLLAAACYARSSERFHRWLLTNRWIGGYLSNYLERKGISGRAKVLVLVLLWTVIGISGIFLVKAVLGRIILALVAIGVTVHIASFKRLER